MKVSVSGPDLDAIASAFAKLPAFSAAPKKIKLDKATKPAGTDWQRASASDKSIDWADGFLWQTTDRVLVEHAHLASDVIALTRWLADVPFELAAIESP